jgi:hypothetical protein
LCFGDLAPRHLASNGVSALDSFGITGRAREIEPHVSQNIILWYTPAIGVHASEVALGGRASLLGGLAIPSGSLGVVLPQLERLATSGM